MRSYFLVFKLKKEKNHWKKSLFLYGYFCSLFHATFLSLPRLLLSTNLSYFTYKKLAQK